MAYVDVTSDQTDWRDVYKLCIGFINPRPIALVSTLSPDGAHNLAPFSFYNMVSANPPVVLICPGAKRDGGLKDTLFNIQATGEFVVATVTEAIAEPMNACAANLPHGRSEFELSGLTPAPASKVKPPLVHESPANIECTLREIITISSEPGGASLVLGDIVAIHVADWVLDERGQVDPRKIRTLGRLGGLNYAVADDAFALPRP